MASQHAFAPKIHFWTPGIFDFKGGIQTYSGFLLKALEQQYPEATIKVFSTHDRAPHQQQVSTSHNTQLFGLGHLPSKIRIPAYGAQIMGAGLWDRPDLILTTHANFSPAAWHLKQLMGIPYWVVAHGFEVWDVQSKLVRRGLKAADKILPVSHYTQKRLMTEQHIPSEKFTWLPNTFDPSRFRPAQKPTHLLQKYGLQPDQPVILTVNRLAAGEDFHAYDQVLQALPQLRKTLPQAHYLIVGKGDDRPRVETLIQRLGLENCVTLAGFVPDADLADYYNLCDVFAMPSKLEGFGIVFLEAMACGKPVLAGNQDGSVDALAGGILGALVHPEQIDHITSTLQQLLEKTYPNPLLYQPERLRQTVIETYGMQAFQAKVRHLLTQQVYQNNPVKIYAG